LKVSASAPGKVTLLGEHAVVYGKPALVAAIDKRVTVVAEERSDGKVVIVSPDLYLRGLRLVVSGMSTSYEAGSGSAPTAAYVTEALKTASEKLGELRGASFEIRSEMPVGAGLGTSAAVAAAVISAYAALQGAELKPMELSEMTRAVEVRVQGSSSGMDPAVVVNGGILYFDPNKGRIRSLNIERLYLLAGYTPRLMSTGESVRRVRILYERHTRPILRVLESIEDLVIEGFAALASREYAHLGELMNINHGLLSALGVSSLRSEEVVHVSRSAGALGSKITGAGMGGAVLSLSSSSAVRKRVAQAVDAIGAQPIVLNCEPNGVIIERHSG
jgi:mevalonate kinase